VFNKNLARIKPSASMKTGLAEGGPVATNLAIGVPDIMPPAAIADLIKAGAQEYKLSYVPSKGTKKALNNLKQLVFENETGIDPDKHLQLVSGAKYGIYLTLKTLCSEGDNVLLMQPYWLSYPEIVHALGLNFHTWDPVVDADGRIEFDIDELERLVREHNIKVLVLNNPNNPAGKVFGATWQYKLNEILQKYGAWMLIDEVYRELVFDPAVAGDFIVSADNVVRVGSLSKSLSIPGLRLGYIYGPENFTRNADLFNQHIQTCINSLSCYVIENLDGALFHNFARQCATVYQQRFDIISAAFAGSGLGLLHSDASFYSLVDMGKYFESGEKACEYLSEKLHINAVPGAPYGKDFASYIRICLTLPNDQLKEKLEFIANNLPVL